jgi:hypothetical protein
MAGEAGPTAIYYGCKRSGSPQKRRPAMTTSSARILMAVTTALMVVVPSLARAQGTPDLSGLWTIDTARSDSGLGPTPMPPGGRADGSVALATNQILVTQTPTDLTITQGIRAALYKLDGTENWSPSLKSTARWDNAKLVITWRREAYLGPRAGQGAYETQTGTDIYSVAGNVLTLEKTVTTPKGTQTGKIVYTRSSEQVTER